MEITVKGPVWRIWWIYWHKWNVILIIKLSCCIIIWNDGLLCFLSTSRLYLQSPACLYSSPDCTDSKLAQETVCQVYCGQGRMSGGIFRLQSATSPLDATKSHTLDQWWTQDVWGTGAKNIKGTSCMWWGVSMLRSVIRSYLTTFCPLEGHPSMSLNLTSS